MSEHRKPILQMPKEMKRLMAIQGPEKKALQHMFYAALRHETEIRNKRLRSKKGSDGAE